jgi:hypothetical protein
MVAASGTDILNQSKGNGQVVPISAASSDRKVDALSPYMNKLMGVLLALTIMAGATMPAAASLFYFDTLAKDYPLDARWSTPPSLISVYDVPTLATTDLLPELDAGALANDMAGKITGVEYMTLYFGGPNNRSNYYATFVVNVTGAITTKGTDPAVKMTLKGTGYSVGPDGNYGPSASLNLTFTTTRPLVHVYQELVLNGVTRTNDYSDLFGTFSGSVKVGKDFVDKLNKEPAWLSDARVGPDYGYIWGIEGTNFVEVWHGSGLQIDEIPLQGQVLQAPTQNAKLSIVAGGYSGKGNINDKNKTYKAALTGVAGTSGIKLNLSGITGPLIAGYTSTNDAGIYDPVQYPSGFITNVVIDAIRTLNLTGKAGGQKVSQKGINVDAPFPP